MPSARRWASAAMAFTGTISAAPLSSPAASAVIVDGTAQATAAHSPRHSTSGNWSGYAATGGTFTSVSADWIQPAVSCGSQNTYSSFWVGLDGTGSESVEQAGTDADCSGGTPVYSSWYEMYPTAPVYLSNPVSPGDVIHGSVAYNGQGSFTLVLSDQTAGWTRTVDANLEYPPLASAEVIAEAPSSGLGVLPLSDFGTASFADASVDGASLASFSPEAIAMGGGGTAKASAGAISPSGAFEVTWHHY